MKTKYFSKLKIIYIFNILLISPKTLAGLPEFDVIWGTTGNAIANTGVDCNHYNQSTHLELCEKVFECLIDADPEVDYSNYTLQEPQSDRRFCLIENNDSTQPNVSLTSTSANCRIGGNAVAPFSVALGLYVCPDAIKNNGSPSCQVKKLDPINSATGNSFQTETDFVSQGAFPLSFTRYYNSADLPIESSGIGKQWRHTFSHRIHNADNPATVSEDVLVLRPDGAGYIFSLTGNTWESENDVTISLTEIKDASDQRTGWEITNTNDDTELYDASGKLLSITNKDGLTQTLNYALPISGGGDSDPSTLDEVTDSFGKTLTFTYTNGRLDSMSDPSGQTYTYSYNNNGYLISIKYPDLTTSDNTDNPERLYLYEDINFPQALTGIIDENGQRTHTWAFDSQGRAIMNEGAGGANHGEITYNPDGSSTVDYVSGRQETLLFTNLLGVEKVSSVEGDPCSDCGGVYKNTSYDSNGFLSSTTDWEGNQTQYTYNTRGLEEERIEAVGTPQERRTTTEWHATYRVPTKVEIFDNNNTLLQRTTYTYDPQGRRLSQTTESL